MENDNTSCNRRQFLGSSAKNAAGMAAGIVGIAGTSNPSHASPSSNSLDNKIHLGVIGVRNRGKVLATKFASLPNVEVVALADIDPKQLAAVGIAVADIAARPPELESDFRTLLDAKEIDAVVVATPDHWHADMAILACQAGKDVYLEKPVANSIRDSQRVVAVARGTGRIIQTGLQQRSGSHFQSAITAIHTGQIGRVNLAKAWSVYRRNSIGFHSDTEPPVDVDYDLWLGPAAHRPFNPNHFHHNWRWQWDFSGGELSNWGIHMLDVARWGLNVDWPVRISASGGNLHFHDDTQTPDTLNVTYMFDAKTILWEHRQWSTHGIEGRSAGVAFYGDRGTLVVDRSGWKIYDRKDAASVNASNLLTPHLQNFVDCVRSRQTPAADVYTGHVSSSLGHLGNIAFRAGHEVNFDATRTTLEGDNKANALLDGPARREWETRGRTG